MRLFSDTTRNGTPGCEINGLCAGAGWKYVLGVSIQAKLYTIDFYETLQSTTISVMQVPLKRMVVIFRMAIVNMWEGCFQNCEMRRRIEVPYERLWLGWEGGVTTRWKGDSRQGPSWNSARSPMGAWVVALETNVPRAYE